MYVIVSHCVYIRNKWDTDNELQKLQLSYRRIDLEIFWVSDAITTVSSTSSRFYRMKYFLNGLCANTNKYNYVKLAPSMTNQNWTRLIKPSL